MAQRSSRKRGRRHQPRSQGRVKAPSTGAKPSAQAPAVKPTASETKSDAPDTVGGWRVEPQLTRSQRRDAQVRAGLTPFAPGERPGVIVASAVISGLIGLSQLIAFFAGLKVHGKSPAAGETVVFCGVMIACAIGMWRLWYGAVLGFMALLAIIATLFSLYLVEVSNLLGLVVVPVIAGSGYLFFKLVRVLSRIQMPRYPGR